MTLTKNFPALRTAPWRLVASVLAAAVISVGCGGADNSGSFNTATPTATQKVAAGSERAAAQATWALCGYEGGNCNFSGTREVRYGTATQYVTRVFTGTALCSFRTFGDPAYGQAKYCWVSSDLAGGGGTTTPPPTTAAPATAWTICAYEGGWCGFSGTRQVRYGTATQFVTRNVTGGTTCSYKIFGDPAYGQAKQCRIGGTTTAPTTPAPTPTPPPAANPSGTYYQTQIFALRDQWVSAEQGQYTTIRARFYGVPMGYNSKIYVHLYNDAGVLVAAAGHHLRYVPSATWNGYVQSDYPAWIPPNTPPGTYRIAIGLYNTLPPYQVLMSNVVGNGVPRINSQWATVSYHVGYMSVRQATQPATPDVTWGQLLQVPTGPWN